MITAFTQHKKMVVYIWVDIFLLVNITLYFSNLVFRNASKDDLIQRQV